MKFKESQIIVARLRELNKDSEKECPIEFLGVLAGTGVYIAALLAVPVLVAVACGKYIFF